MGGLMDALYDPKEGTVLGRNFASWAKITGFYLVYYSLLGVLFYAYTIMWYEQSRVYSTAPVGTKPFVAYSRLDQPGAATHPFKEMYEDGDVDVLNMFDKDIQVKYCEKIVAYFNNVQLEDTVDCSQAETNPKTGTCAVSIGVRKAAGLEAWNDKQLNDLETCTNLLAKQRPMVIIDLNKIYGWTPKNSGGVAFNCYEYNPKTNQKVDESKFAVQQLSESAVLAQHYFPYNGLSSKGVFQSFYDDWTACDTDECAANPHYNKPFVAFIVAPQDDKAWDNQRHNFRCEIIAANIDRPAKDGVVGNPIPADAADLFKLGIGTTQFGFQWKK
jgi:hypothetical protein